MPATGHAANTSSNIATLLLHCEESLAVRISNRILGEARTKRTRNIHGSIDERPGVS